MVIFHSYVKLPDGQRKKYIFMKSHRFHHASGILSKKNPMTPTEIPLIKKKPELSTYFVALVIIAARQHGGPIQGSDPVVAKKLVKKRGGFRWPKMGDS